MIPEAHGRPSSTAGWWRLLLAAVAAVLVALLGAGTASAATPTVAETRVGASTPATAYIVGPHEGITAGQRWGNAPPQAETVAGSCVAANALPALPKALSGGPADTYVYFGTRGGKNVYTGITNNLTRHGAQHGERFDQLVRVTSAPVTRGQARSIEQALIGRNPGFENKINSISPTHSYYDDAVSWGEAWLWQNGF